MAQIFAGLFAEGSTDIQFLRGILERTLIDVVYECTGQIDIEVFPIIIETTGLDFPQRVLAASKSGIENYLIQIICIHTDADNSSSERAYQERINVAIQQLNSQNPDEYCKVVVPIVPIQETESWMLADKELLKREIGTSKTDEELGINRPPENIARPKEVIENAIRIARESFTRRRRGDLTISDLYSTLGLSVGIEKLDTISSYRDFKMNIRQAFKTLGFLHF